ncbi:MAG: HAD-IA family hydrolase [Ruminococcus sp.]|nr:HAD-IA family hydrolase [Ruminococcus sp.]
MIKLVIFDLDGTLANTLEDLADATNYGLKKAGMATHSLEKYNKFVGSGIDNLVKRAIYPETDTRLFDIVKSGFNEYYSAHSIDKTKAYNTTEELLDKLDMQRILTAVLSNKPNEFVGEILRKIFPDHRFSCAWGKKPEFSVKPNPDALNAIIREVGVNKEQCLYVGDSDVDCFTAQNAGIKCCGVSWGFRGKDELLNAGADFVIDDALQLLEILEK